MNIERRKTSAVLVGRVGIGSDYPVSIQSMTNTDTRNAVATVSQIIRLADAGCDIVRVAVPDQEAVEALRAIIASSPIPVIADIHFDYQLALKAIDHGIHGLRINPGNIGDEKRVKRLADASKDAGIPIRIGVNSGSVEPEMLAKYCGINANSLVESALKHVAILERHNFTDIKISIKASEVPLMIESYRNIAQKVSYPLHLGVTEAGTIHGGMIKSAVGIGTLLAEGIGDTIRVSLTGDPVPEIGVALHILKSLHLRQGGIEIISCPTCGRCEINLEKIALEVEKKTAHYKENIKIAIMGCVVNGPGEAREADIGLAGGRDCGIIFRKGEVVRKVRGKELIPEFMAELDRFLGLT